MKKSPYWLEVEARLGASERPKDSSIVIIGSGLAGLSTAYWLTEMGVSDIVVVDFRPLEAATFRNCGHILNGAVESMAALVALHGEAVAKEIWAFSCEICNEVKTTIDRLGIDADYRQDGYLVIAVDDAENEEIKHSIKLLGQAGFPSLYLTPAELHKLGFKNVFGGRYEATSAQAHPVKFRNGLLDHCLRAGVKYHSGIQVLDVSEVGGRVRLKTEPYGELTFDAAVIAANAYSPLLSEFFRNHRLLEPFRGQIMVSKPLRHEFGVRYPHSFDHGYEYALVTPDNRLMMGGWRNHSPTREIGTYDITSNPAIEEGLHQFTREHYEIKEKIEWEYSWGGIMAASKTGFPFIGPTESPLIFTVSAFTGHGFSWAHGSAKLLAGIMMGEPLPAIARFFDPRGLASLK